MVDQIRKVSKQTVRRIENAYAVIVIFCTYAAVWKLALQPKVHSALGMIPAWQIIAGIIGAGLAYTMYSLVEGTHNG